MKKYLIITSVLAFILSCSSDKLLHKTDKNLHSKFKNPSTEARPFVRWWWNDNKLKTEEIDRELEVLKAVGFGGVEINPIAMSKVSDIEDDDAVYLSNYDLDKENESLVWMSDKWVDMVVHASKKAHDLGMITDLIAGTGWPFGGEFLKAEETCQRMVSDKIFYKSGDIIEENEVSLIALYKERNKNTSEYKLLSNRTTYELANISLVPVDCQSTNEVVNLNNFFDENGNLVYNIKKNGGYFLSYTLLQQNFRDVTLGAVGGAGPVMDHYKKETTYAYLSRIKKISEQSGIPLNQLIRAIFCDSIEVSGANWTDEFGTIFYNSFGYELEGWMPFLFSLGLDDYTKDDYSQGFSKEFKEQLKRVRYDYNKLLVELFLENFTKTYKDFCEENGVLCRYQAYGIPFLMGMLDGYMIPDIPESNNWIYTVEMKDSIWKWNQEHGYMTWNMYAAAGSHLTDKKITSCVTRTNLEGVFKTTLEEIKQHDDMNFITGINHSVLHGYNYSPPKEAFPGWIRFGTYFSEYNTWWRHLKHWVDYNSRLSSIFQNSQADKSIAIIGPTADLWGDKGLSRIPFHTDPEYLYKLWEPISQLGYSCEYINQNVLVGSTIKDGTISFGNMTYKLLVLASLQSIHPDTALALERFIESGGKVVFIDELPIKSLHYTDYQKNDEFVKNTMKNLSTNYPEAIVKISKPKSLDKLFEWTRIMLNDLGMQADVLISNPTNKVYQIHQYTEDKDIYFFTNVHRNESASFTAKFPIDGKYPWIWNPETGERKPYHYISKTNELNISLKPLESLLIVFEDEEPFKKAVAVNTDYIKSKVVDGSWKVIGNRVDNNTYTWEMMELVDFSKSNDTTQNSFSGDIIYKTIILNDGDFTHIDLGDVNEGVTELYLNGKSVGKRWYGKAIYEVKDYLKDGQNTIEVHYTTVLANYCKSLDNPLVKVWTRRYKDQGLVPTGLEGPVKLLKYL